MTVRILQRALLALLAVSIVAAQMPNNEIPLIAQKLLAKPRYSRVELTRTDGRSENGTVLRVTNEFVAFRPLLPTAACEDIPLSEIARVQWLPHATRPSMPSPIVVMIIFSPFLVAEAIANPFRRVSPPLVPPRGDWEAGGSHGIPKSSLMFKATTVKYRTTVGKRGHWWIENSSLHLVIDGEPERVTSFHFSCDNLVLDNPAEQLIAGNGARLGNAPILGDWGHRGLWLDFQPDGVLERHEMIEREGSFENTPTSVTMRWADRSRLGGDQWVAQIKQRHIVLSIDGATTEFHYVPHSRIVGL